MKTDFKGWMKKCILFDPSNLNQIAHEEGEDEILFLSEEIIEKVDGKDCEWFKLRMIANLKTGEIRTFPLNVEMKGM